jgi:hypothetical protein
MVFELSYLGHEEVVVLTEMNDACIVRGNGGHGWPVYAVLMIVTHEHIAGTKKPRVQFSLSVQDFCIDGEEESPNPVQTSASDVTHTITQQVTGQDGGEFVL